MIYAEEVLCTIAHENNMKNKDDETFETNQPTNQTPLPPLAWFGNSWARLVWVGEHESCICELYCGISEWVSEWAHLFDLCSNIDDGLAQLVKWSHFTLLGVES